MAQQSLVDATSEFQVYRYSWSPSPALTPLLGLSPPPADTTLAAAGTLPRRALMLNVPLAWESNCKQGLGTYSARSSCGCGLDIF